MTNKLRPRPDSSALAECRRGTKTHRGYVLLCIGNNGVPGGRAAALATPRQAKKGWKLALQEWQRPASQPKPEVQGRILRAVLRAALQDMGDWAEDRTPYAIG